VTDPESVRPTPEVDRPGPTARPAGPELGHSPGPIEPDGPLDVVAASANDPVEAARPVAIQPPAIEPPAGGPPPSVERHGTCTTAQLRRFIKSRAYIPMHEIRRRFLIATEDDDVTGIDLSSGRIFVGLPDREGHMLGELLRGGEVGYELQLDPVSPIVIGVYPMRPVTRG
jgi:hypothetical protein